MPQQQHGSAADCSQNSTTMLKKTAKNSLSLVHIFMTTDKIMAPTARTHREESGTKALPPTGKLTGSNNQPKMKECHT